METIEVPEEEEKEAEGGETCDGERGIRGESVSYPGKGKRAKGKGTFHCSVNSGRGSPDPPHSFLGSSIPNGSSSHLVSLGLT
jgi:hypothetical protein